MLRWEKTGKTVYGDGGSDTAYTLLGHPEVRVESRKRAIPHADGVGSWMHTDYIVMVNGYDARKCRTLKDAKEYVAMHIDKREGDQA